MYAQIVAKTISGPPTKGKTAWVNSKALTVTIERDQPKHLGGPTWYIKICAESGEMLNTGERGGDYREIERLLEIHLEAEDLRKVLFAAVSEGLLRFEPTVTPAE
jgi:hypothetical protein